VNPGVNNTFGLSGDLPQSFIALAIGLAVLGVVLLLVELSRQEGAERRWLVAATGILASALCLLALLRPVVITSRGSRVGPKVTVLVDRSRSLLLPGDDGRPRWEKADLAIAGLKAGRKDIRYGFFGFGEGKTSPLEPGPPRADRSELGAALRDAMQPEGELPRAIVVISDGAFEGPTTLRDLPARADGAPAIPIHTVAVARKELKDATIRAVRSAGAAVAHQPLQLAIEIACTGGLSCGSLPVSVRELLEGAPPALLASGVANVENGVATLELPITLDRAGPRLVVVELDTPSGDQIPENNRRYLAVDVARERVRVLHVAGRPTYDVRALRTWLKSNASVDTVAFFILRSNEDEVVASDSELALIKFPVEELFTEHLPSFDAVILQDFNAKPYGLYRYLPNLTKYVETGGGLVMVGGPDAFLGGSYDGTPLERVLPVELGEVPGQASADLTDIVPRITQVGRAAPMLTPLRALFGDELPTMPGANVVGAAKPGALVLWEHPLRKTKNGKPMPLLTLGDAGDGRSVAIAVDGVHRLGFSEVAAKVAGRGHGAFWDGMLGWLMRDPRFEPAQVTLERACVADEPLTLRVTPLPGVEGPVIVDVTASDGRTPPVHVEVPLTDAGAALDVPVGKLAPGGYIAKVRVGSGTSTRRAFPCEKGGDEWADARPDEERLAALASATGGTFVRDLDMSKITFPEATLVNAEHRVSPVFPPWGWTLAAAIALSAHWIARRRSGLALRLCRGRKDGIYHAERARRRCAQREGSHSPEGDPRPRRRLRAFARRGRAHPEDSRVSCADRSIGHPRHRRCHRRGNQARGHRSSGRRPGQHRRRRRFQTRHRGDEHAHGQRDRDGRARARALVLAGQTYPRGRRLAARRRVGSRTLHRARADGTHARRRRARQRRAHRRRARRCAKNARNCG
jgi:uncharacterized membrane protein